jgi:DNA-binding IclR family transcriptional regulator
VRVLHKALDVLETLRSESAGLPLAGLAALTAMPKPTDRLHT